jgi:16S rRNA (adenine1518-N6/adenine1519-N6)-dimethyltransferase
VPLIKSGSGGGFALEHPADRPLKAYGQHILTDEKLLNLIVREANPTARDVVLEVGAGPGNLTRHLLKSGASVVAVEIDRRFENLVPAELGNPPELIWLAEDILESKNRLNPAVGEVVTRALEGKEHLVVASNLPYSTAVPFLSLLALSPWRLKVAVVTVQLEVAERIVARPGTKAYGPISVLVSLVGKARVICRVGRGKFRPRPRVESAVLRMDFEEPLKRLIYGNVHAVARAIFPYRRKSLRSSLRAALYERMCPALVQALAGIFEPSKRTEAMTPQDFVSLTELLKRLWPEGLQFRVWRESS